MKGPIVSIDVSKGKSDYQAFKEMNVKYTGSLMLAYKQDQSKRENLHQWYNRKRMIQKQRKAKENGK